MSNHIIQAKNTRAPFLTTPSIGHFLLFAWINEDAQRKKLFENCLLNISTKFDHDFFISRVDDAARRCWREFQEIYAQESGEINEEEALYLYTLTSEKYSN